MSVSIDLPDNENNENEIEIQDYNNITNLDMKQNLINVSDILNEKNFERIIRKRFNTVKEIKQKTIKKGNKFYNIII